MSLVQIDLRRGSTRATADSAPAGIAIPEGDGRPVDMAGGADAGHGVGRATAGMVLAGGMVLLAPIAAAAVTSATAAAVLLVGLLLLGMLAVLLRPTLAEVDPS